MEHTEYHQEPTLSDLPEQPLELLFRPICHFLVYRAVCAYDGLFR